MERGFKDYLRPSWLFGCNERRKTLEYSELSRLMNMALDMGGYMVSEYNPREDVFKDVRGHMIGEHVTMEKAVAALHPDDKAAFFKKVEELQNKVVNTNDLFVRRNRGTAGKPDWQYLTGNCIRERDMETGHTTFLLVAKDITAEQEEQRRNEEQKAKYLKAFDISLVAMSFYDKDGKLLEINERMREVIGVNEENQQFFWETSLFEAPLFKEVLMPGMTETVHACQHMYYPDINLSKYLEYRIQPAFTDEGEIRYYAVTVRDISAERKLYLEQQSTERQLKIATAEANKFEAQMNYLLKNSDMFIWRSSIKDSTIVVSRSLRTVESRFSFAEYLDSILSEDRDAAKTTLNNPLVHGRSFNFVRYYVKSPLTHKEGWFAVSGMPYSDENSAVLGHFGVIRDVTRLIRSQEELRRETSHAQQSGKLKAAFLANMTHEIRTPLNAIVGFSDLLHTVLSPEERSEFIRIIRQNCDLLLRLIDDILETSNMEGRPQSIEPEDIDFSRFFDEACQTVARRVQEPGVSFIADNPYPAFPACVDKERILQVVTNFVTNAVKYTHQGHIKVGYRSQDDGIYIYCEDTGAGIPKEKQASVFDRFVKLNEFVQGTGLGLAICKSIADRCNGRIGVSSEGEGKGSTFWIWIPRYLTSSKLIPEK